VSIDSHSMLEHELNRGLNGLERRITEGVAAARAQGIPTCATVTVNRLVRYDALPETLARLGFGTPCQWLPPNLLIFKEFSATGNDSLAHFPVTVNTPLMAVRRTMTGSPGRARCMCCRPVPSSTT